MHRQFVFLSLCILHAQQGCRTLKLKLDHILSQINPVRTSYLCTKLRTWNRGDKHMIGTGTNGQNEGSEK